MWKFHDFFVIQNLREINFGNSTSVKSAILANLEAPKFEFHKFLHFLKAEIYLLNQAPEMAKNGSFFDF